MNRKMISIAIASAMMAMQRAPAQLATTGYRPSYGGVAPNRRTMRKGYRTKGGSNYKAHHQGEQERARRLRVGSAAWHSARAMR